MPPIEGEQKIDSFFKSVSSNTKIKINTKT